MNTTSFFGDMLQTITERGRRFLSFGPREENGDALQGIEALCETLLSSRGEASGMALAKDILDRWQRFDGDRQRAFMRLLLSGFGPKAERLEKAIDAYRAEQTPKALLELHVAAEPRRQELIRRLNLAPNGIATLVRMREVLLKLKAEDPDLEAVDSDFAHLFGSWFNRGFLVLRPISWSQCWPARAGTPRRRKPSPGQLRPVMPLSRHDGPWCNSMLSGRAWKQWKQASKLPLRRVRTPRLDSPRQRRLSLTWPSKPLPSTRRSRNCGPATRAWPTGWVRWNAPWRCWTRQ